MTENETQVLFDLSRRVGEVTGQLTEVKDHVGRVDDSVTSLGTSVAVSFASMEKSIQKLGEKMSNQEAAGIVWSQVRIGAFTTVGAICGWLASYFSGGVVWLRHILRG